MNDPLFKTDAEVAKELGVTTQEFKEILPSLQKAVFRQKISSSKTAAICRPSNHFSTGGTISINTVLALGELMAKLGLVSDQDKHIRIDEGSVIFVKKSDADAKSVCGKVCGLNDLSN